jgi:hypothetical protein
MHSRFAPSRPHLLASLVVATAAVLGAVSAPTRAADDAAAGEVPPTSTLIATARRAGLRVLEGDHLALATDRPVRAGDGVADLPRIFDAAFAAWCGHYGLDPAEHHDWRAFGCLVVDRERFRAAGLLPDRIPEFPAGFCQSHRFWMADQSNPAYRRHLLLHEGVHAFTITLRGLDAPPWYTEGIAEYLATHRLDAAADGSGRFVSTPLPLRADDVEQLGRIEKLRAARADGTIPGLADVFATPTANHRDLSAYAASWAAVTMLAQHPHWRRLLATTEQGSLDRTFTDRLAALPEWDAARAERDFDAFTDELDYGYDPSRSAIDWSPGRPLTASQRIAVKADRGWQNSGWSLRAGERYAAEASGRCTIGMLPASASGPECRLESEADGISLRWYRGRPLGRLLVAQWVERPDDGGRPRFVVLATGANGQFTAATDGVAWLKINDPPGELDDNEGQLAVSLGPE